MQRRASTSRRSGLPGSAAAAHACAVRPRHGHHDRAEPRRDGGAVHPGGAGPRGATSPVTAAVCDGGVWLANTVSPLLPVPDLTNSLAVGRLELPVTAYARMMLFAGAAPACLLLVRRCWPGRRWSSPPRVRRHWSRCLWRCGGAGAVAPGAAGRGALPGRAWHRAARARHPAAAWPRRAPADSRGRCDGQQPRQQPAGLAGAQPTALAAARGQSQSAGAAVGLTRTAAVARTRQCQRARRLVAVRSRRARAAPTPRDRPAPGVDARCRSATAPRLGRRRTTAPPTGSTGRGASGRARSVAHRARSAAAS